MKGVLVAGFTNFVVGCLFLVVGIVAFALTPDGLKFFANHEASEDRWYEALQMVGFFFSISGALVTAVGVKTIMEALVRK